MTTNHKYYLDLAFKIAERNLGKTKLNPSVGALVVKNNRVISSGVTSVNGKPHAEYNALIKNDNFSGADLYTTLEPCTHYGETPPCVNIIVKKKIKNVFYGSEDPDLRTFRKAKKYLSKKKIKTKFIKNNNFKNFYSSYLINKKKKIPYISAKIAISRDYYSINKKFRWITNEHSRKIVHLLRSKNDCIFSTSKSINLDNSLLNCRLKGLNNFKPDLFIIDLNVKLKKNLLLNNLCNNRKTFLITTKENSDKAFFFKKKGFKIVIIKSLKTKNDFNAMFHEIYKLGYSRALFETGLTFLNSLLNYKLLNNLYIFQTNKNLKINGYNNSDVKKLKKIKLPKKINVNLDNDSLFKVKF
jgi:diaminohydroxyphosphoribosylaminopyrimidine deaminase / 5-amino-6-(5-phosphoribosylamino)uracil reductase